MAKFRMIHTDFWDDPKVVEEMTAEDKYFFLYLLTNSNTTQIGIYQITKKQMAFDMGYSPESVNALLDRFINHHKLVLYNPETREIAIKNWGRYNFNRGGKPVLDCVRAELKNVKDISLISFVGERIEKEEIKFIYDSFTTRTEKTGKKSETLLNQGFDDTSAISGQEKEEEEEKEEEKEKEEEIAAANRAELINQFISLRGHGFAHSPKDEDAAAEILSVVPLDEALKLLKQRFDTFEPKHNRDRINSLGYCVGYILDKFMENLSEGDANNGSRQKVYKHGSGFGRPATKNAEQALREAEAARRAWGG
ncbi:hypothetical protein [Cytobacillus oceanisediminis]|uniref:hypothetical protein n=1 Tax=Cytobacillus oceanisediminis TaxID=665099 RepID=UPI00207ABD11|nr:hypothetical protein [Cytobacillus oceanisediminis]USK43754.1 hypothetical protein LIT27_24770 [Cytobacillus oceanisediminis]